MKYLVNACVARAAHIAVLLTVTSRRKIKLNRPYISATIPPHPKDYYLLSHPKDHNPDRQRPGVIYRVACTTCPSCYIEQTGRTLEMRLKEHRTAVASGDTDSLHWRSTGWWQDMQWTGRRRRWLSPARTGGNAVPWSCGTSGLTQMPWTETQANSPTCTTIVVQVGDNISYSSFLFCFLIHLVSFLSQCMPPLFLFRFRFRCLYHHLASICHLCHIPLMKATVW